MKWSDVPAGIINGAQQRFWTGLVGHADKIALLMVNEPAFLEGLVKFAIDQYRLRFWKLWKQIKLGIGVGSGPDFFSVFEDAKIALVGSVCDVLKQKAFTVASEPVEINLVVVTPGELGFSERVSYKDVCARAKDFGLGLCPAEVGPQLRLQYRDQPSQEWLIIAMKDIRDSRGNPWIFCIEDGDDGLVLDCINGHANSMWNPDHEFVFVLPKGVAG